VSERRWIDPRQPQTLQAATFLLYFNAAFGVLYFVLGVRIEYLIPALAGAVGANGMANEKRWGYQLAVVAAILRLVLPIVDAGIGDLLRYDPIGFMFAAAVVALLLHPQSRDYQRIWYS
jgi:hypothetical protein